MGTTPVPLQEWTGGRVDAWRTSGTHETCLSVQLSAAAAGPPGEVYMSPGLNKHLYIVPVVPGDAREAKNDV